MYQEHSSCTKRSRSQGHTSQRYKEYTGSPLLESKALEGKAYSQKYIQSPL